MRIPLLFIAVSLSVHNAWAHTPDYAAHFTGQTMRIDLFHSGGPDTEIVAVDQVVADGPWPGSRTQLIDTSNLGKYLLEVIDPGTNQPLYTRGFATIYGEWETTAEAKSTFRTFHESLRLPWPKHPVQIVLNKRTAKGFSEIWSTLVDPDSRFVNPATLTPPVKTYTLLENGPPAVKVDLLLLGDGYTDGETRKFLSDAQRLSDALFEVEPFRSRRGEFNVRAVLAPAQVSGVTRPRAGEFNRTPLSAQYNIFDSERYVLTYDNRALRNVAAAAPYDFIEILVNESQYGGGGIYNFQATTAVDSGFADYLFIHEFGHHFAALGDEYYTSPVSYETGAEQKQEPWEPNVTALHDPAKLKWAHLVEADTALPTSWPKETFEKHSREFQARRAELRKRNAPEEELEALFREEQAFMTKLLGEHENAGKVGAFEGAGYEATGLYRPEMDCIMFTRDEVGFCRVCSEAIERVIDQYSR